MADTYFAICSSYEIAGIVLFVLSVLYLAGLYVYGVVSERIRKKREARQDERCNQG